MTNKDLVAGRSFECIRTFMTYYICGKTYFCHHNGTIRDEYGFDYDVLSVDKYFREPEMLKEKNNKG